MSYRFAPPTPDYSGGRVGRVSGSTLSAVMSLLGIGALFTAGGAAVSIVLGGSGFFLGLIGGFACLIALQFVRERAPWNLILLFAFTTLEGFVIGSVLDAYLAQGLGKLVLAAAAATGSVTIVAGMIGYYTKRNLARFRPILFIALIALLVACVIGLFVHLTVLQIAISAGGALLFTGFLIFDLNRIAETPNASQGTAIMLAASVYLDVVNLFFFILSLLGFAGNGRR
jgi:FtsH-binding integral membrane protein